MIKIITTFILLSPLIFTPLFVNAEIEQDNITVVVDISNMDDRIDLYNLIESYNIDVYDFIYIHSIVIYGAGAGEPLKVVSDIALNGNPFIGNNGDDGYSLSSEIGDYIDDMTNDVTQWSIYNVEGITPLYYVITLPPPPPPLPLFNDTTLSITLLILLILSLGMYMIFKSNLILLPTIILWLVFIGNTNNDLIVLFATTLFIITIVITFFKDKKGDNW